MSSSIDGLAKKLLLSQDHYRQFQSLQIKTNTQEILSLNPSSLFEFDCENSKLIIKDRDSGLKTTIDFADILKDQISINGTRIKLDASLEFESLFNKISKPVQGACLWCGLFLTELHAQSTTPQWKNINIDSSISNTRFKVQYTVTALTAVAASEVKTQCSGGPEGTKTRLSYVVSNLNPMAWYRTIVYGGCTEPVSNQMLSYMSGFDDFQFQCTKDGKIAKVSLRHKDYLDTLDGKPAPPYQAQLNFDYSDRDLTRVTKTGSLAKESCVAKVNTSGEAIQILSSQRSAFLCAANDYYGEFRAGDVSSQNADVKSRSLLLRDGNDPIGAYNKKIATLSSTMDQNIRTWSKRLERFRSGKYEYVKRKAPYLSFYTQENTDDPDAVFLKSGGAHCGEADCLECNGADCEPQLETKVKEAIRRKQEAIAAVAKPVITDIAALKLNIATMTPTLPAFFAETQTPVSNPNSPEASRVHSLVFKRQPVRLSNLSPLANLDLVSKCCANSKCKSEVDANRARNNLAPASGTLKSAPSAK